MHRITSARRAASAAAAVALSGALGGCAGPEVMIIANVAQAAVKASVEYAERNRPTPAQAWRRDRLDSLASRAETGDAAAQYRLAVRHEAAASGGARDWMCRAARQGHARAQLQLGHWHNEDRRRVDPWPFLGLRPDDRIALVWYRRAAAGGETGAELFLEQVASRLAARGEAPAGEGSRDGCGPAAFAGPALSGGALARE